MSGYVKLEIDGAVATVTIANEKKRNALSTEMWPRLEQGIREASQHGSVRVTVLRGAGRSAFCAGGDFDDLETLTGDAEARGRFVQSVEAVFASVLQSRVPIVAMLHGSTAGGGMALACACDLRLADTELRMGIPAARLGIIPDTTEVDAVMSLVGPARAAELLYTGRLLDAEEALAWGLVDRVLDPNDLEESVYAFAADIAKAAPGALSATRRLLVNGRFARGTADTADTADALGGVEFSEALAAIRERRQPVFPDLE